MSIEDRLKNAGYDRIRPPADYKPARNFIGSEGDITTEAVIEDISADETKLLELAQLDPAEWRIVSPEPETRMWQRYDLEWLHYYKFRVAKRTGFELQFPGLWSAAKAAARKATPAARGGRVGAVIVWADPQTGKVGVRGGSEALITRVAQVQAGIDAWLRKVKPDCILFADVGDGVEGFENVAGQMFTNDLSLMDQLDLEATFEFDTIAMAAAHAPVTVAKTTSNHAAWRNGKNVLGRPSDDWGIYLGKQIAKQFALLPKLDVTFAYPQTWDHSMSVDFNGTIIGLHHGHMVNRPSAIPQWWAGQTHGAGAVADADVLLTGHFHHLLITPTGRNRLSGRQKWWIQAPTLDNGSDWYRNFNGDDSEPAVVVFLVDENGFNLGSLDFIQPPKE